jgi:hypothetical protein
MNDTKVSVEDLLKPRYRVIADYPGSQFTVGQIIQKQKYMDGKWHVKGFLNEPENYPDIFKPLEWWEEREPEEMPQYVKSEHRKRVAKARFDMNDTSAWFMFLDGEVHPYAPGTEWLPATETDYLNYITTTPSKGGDK